MLKNILNLNGVKTLSKEEQRKVRGGASPGCNPAEECCYLCTCSILQGGNYYIFPGQSCADPSCNNSSPNCV